MGVFYCLEYCYCCLLFAPKWQAATINLIVAAFFIPLNWACDRGHIGGARAQFSPQMFAAASLLAIGTMTQCYFIQLSKVI
jgi:hypothetical protein